MQQKPHLINCVRAGFILQNKTFSRVCFEKGVNPSNATKALDGTLTNEKSLQIKEELINESNANELMTFLANQGEQSDKKILRLPEVMNLTGLGRSSIYRKIEDGCFPKQVKISNRAAGWLQADIYKFIDSLNVEGGE